MNQNLPVMDQSVMNQLNDPENLNKYKTAGTIATKAVTEGVNMAKPGTKLIDLSNNIQEYINQELDKTYKSIKYKGLSFPVCLSVNNIVGHYTGKSTDVLKDGDLLKIELGVHIDGFPASITYTTLIMTESTVIDDKKSNVLKAVIGASKEIFNNMKPGTLNTEIVSIMKKYADQYNCNLPISNEFGVVPGIFSYQVSNGILDGYTDDNYTDDKMHRFILSRNNPEYGFFMVELELEENEIYAIDIVMSSGSGKLKQTNDICNIYRRNYEIYEGLRLKASREVLGSFGKEVFPQKINPDIKFKLGIKECLDKGVVEPYPVVSEKENEYVARIKFTVIVKDKPVLICAKSGDTELEKLK